MVFISVAIFSPTRANGVKAIRVSLPRSRINVWYINIYTRCHPTLSQKLISEISNIENLKCDGDREMMNGKHFKLAGNI